MSTYDDFPAHLLNDFWARLEITHALAVAHAADSPARAVHIARIGYRHAQEQAERHPDWPPTWKKVATTQTPMPA